MCWGSCLPVIHGAHDMARDPMKWLSWAGMCATAEAGTLHIKGPYHTYKEIDAAAWYMSKTKKTKTISLVHHHSHAAVLRYMPDIQIYRQEYVHNFLYKYTHRDPIALLNSTECLLQGHPNKHPILTHQENLYTSKKNREVRQTPIRPPCAPPPLPLCHYAACQGTGKRSRRLLAKPRELVKQWTCTSEKISVGLRGLNN